MDLSTHSDSCENTSTSKNVRVIGSCHLLNGRIYALLTELNQATILFQKRFHLLSVAHLWES